ncbi:hypothetical protein ES319_A13G164600v1 [Gossypium barbadense]|uniref:Uncharacterized protein n=1 Tax=Gossypium barbadense TaxID=3634 RepID=A0A5J5T080_GOSBA|nr:hypothetical protein ES319_A13G164600v1 [Gossypium barbadense]
MEASKSEDENQTQRCRNTTSSGGGIGNTNIGRSFKKQRPKKVPERGLGVAQLEKIRNEEEEEQKKHAAVLSPPTVSHKSSYVPLPIPSFHLSNQSSSSSSVPFPASTGGALLPVNGSVKNGHNLWSSCECDIEKECCGLDPGLVFNTTFQQSSSSMVNNLTSRNSSTSLLNYQMEPPSNQSYYGNCTCLLPEHDKVIGMNRSCPLSLDNAPPTSIHNKYPSMVRSITGEVEATSSSNGSGFNFEPETLNYSMFRKGRCCSTSNGVFDGDSHISSSHNYFKFKMQALSIHFNQS